MTYLFSDIEGSTRLWETDAARIAPALAWHDALARAAVERHRGGVVKMTGDGIHAFFDDPVDAVAAVLEIQLALQDSASAEHTAGLALRVRCGLHAGADQRRDNDFFGPAVNRAARIMQAAHGGQVLLSQVVADGVRLQLPDGAGLRDLGDVRLRDLTGPERLFQLLHPRLRSDFPALRSLASTPNNLAQQVNSFVGRGRELAQVRAQLADPSLRLLTLLGMGGLGKSRLSVQVAAEVLDEFPDGVWFIELAPLADPRSVVQAVAGVLGVKEEAGGSVLDAVLRYVRDKTLLVVLDNCEHVVQACAELARALLQAAPRVKLLASSRDALQIAGEQVCQVMPLAAPVAGAAATPAALAGIDAVQLFIDRATAAQPAFRVTEKNAAAVAEICRQVDGIPLALELAAARTRALSVEAIAARLHDRFKLLVTGDRTVLPRQRTLRALIDWSYDLLSDAEKTLFARLSVFAGGWTLEAAEAVGAGGAIDDADVLDLLARLVEKSLVIADVERERYRMLDTVRQYAGERLLDMAGEAGATRARHFDHFLALAEAARPHLISAAQAQWVARLDLERENVLSAHDWADGEPARGAQQARLVRALRMYWFTRGQLNRGLQMFLGLLARPAFTPRDGERCRLLFGAGWFCFVMGRYREARGHLDESLAIALETGDATAAASVRQPLGMACLVEGDLVTARRVLEEALAAAQQLQDPRETAAAHAALGMLCRAEGRLPAARALYEAALGLCRQLGDHESVGRNLLNLAMVDLDLGATAAARAMTAEALQIGAEIGSRFVEQSALDLCTGLAAAAGEHALALRFFGAAEALRAELGLNRDPADDAFVQKFVVQAGGRADPAAAWTGSVTDMLGEARRWLTA